MPVVRIDCRQIKDSASFHAVFAREMGFPGFYGRNLDAWIDCMTSLDCPADGMTTVHCAPPDVVTLLLDHVDSLPEDIYRDIHDCAAFVNWRRMDMGQPPVLAIACDRSQSAS
jgi:hypothetical protein